MRYLPHQTSECGYLTLVNGQTILPLSPPQRILMAPGPTNLPPAVLQALIAPITGHKDPFFLKVVMDETAQLLRSVFSTQNATSMSLPGTGGAGMEASLANLLQDGDTAVVCVNGMFSARMQEIARRHGAKVMTVTAPWGRAIDPEDVRRAVQQTKPRVICTVHGETSTGVLQPIEEIGRIAQEFDSFLIVDAVATLGGVPVLPDAWNSAICYAASQKCLSAPPGVAPITVSPGAMEYVRNRNGSVRDWYFDLNEHDRYWFAEERVYHHTAPVPLVYALHEALRLVAEEGNEARWARHALHHRALVAGLDAMELELFAERSNLLPTVVSVRVPSGVNDTQLRGALLEDYGIEISGGLGEFSGKMWRIGVMGYSANQQNILFLLSALETLLARQGFGSEQAAGIAAANAVYSMAGDGLPT
jgi:alanine-glyoxylate transaminase/serine-glyoxylate transaminase/serine-pyruvate transaminase